METKIYGYAARDLTVSADGRVLDDSVRIHYTRPHLRGMQSFEGGEVKTTYHYWQSSEGNMLAPRGSFPDLKWNDEPRKVLITINDAEFDDDGKATD